MSLMPDDNLFETGSNLMRQIYTAIIRLDSKTDNLAGSLADLIKNTKDKHDDHEERIRKLEQRPYVSPATVWRLLGTLTGIGALIVAVISITK